MSTKHIRREPWVTKGLLTSSINKTKLYNKKLSKPTEYNICKYKSYNKLYNKLRRTLKIRYYEELFSSNRNNIKQTWTELKKIIGKQTNKNVFPEFFTINNKKVTNKYEIAESFNKYFVGIGNSVQKQIPKQNATFVNYISHNIASNIFSNPYGSN